MICTVAELEELEQKASLGPIEDLSAGMIALEISSRNARVRA
jgi:hypothetical protein